MVHPNSRAISMDYDHETLLLVHYQPEINHLNGRGTLVQIRIGIPKVPGSNRANDSDTKACF